MSELEESWVRLIYVGFSALESKIGFFLFSFFLLNILIICVWILFLRGQLIFYFYYIYFIQSEF